MFLKTTTEKRHYHIVYMSQNGGGAVSENKYGHHNVFIPEDQSSISLTPAEDGHNHEIIGQVPLEKKKGEKQTDTDKVNEVFFLYKEARLIEKPSRDKGLEAEDFIFGGEKQWKESDKKKLDAADRAVLTVDEIEAKVDLLSGYQRQSRTDTRFFPIEGGDQRISEILNILSKNIDGQTDYDAEETKVFDDQIITGRGVLQISIDRKDDIEGKIKIKRYPWANVSYGPHEQEDLEDCEYAVKHKKYSIAKVKSLFPKKAKELERIQNLTDVTDKSEDGEWIKKQYGQYTGEGEEALSSLIDKEHLDIAKKEILVIECQRKKYFRIPVLTYVQEEFVFPATDWADKDVSIAKSIPGINLIYIQSHKMRVTKTAWKILLDDTYEDPTVSVLNDFDTVPAYAKKRGDNWWGKVEKVKDQQREINKLHSFTMDVMNRMAAYIWFIDNETFAPSEETNFLKSSSTPGAVFKLQNINRKPEKEEGIKFPSEIVELRMMAKSQIRETMNINADLLGLNSRSESGIAQQEKKKQGLVGNEFLFDNLSMAKRKINRLKIKLIPEVFTAAKILRTIKSKADQSTEESPLELNGKPAGALFSEGGENDLAEIGELLSNPDAILANDVAIGEGQYSPTARSGNFMIWSEQVRNGFPLPPDELLNISDLPDKGRILKKMAAAQRAGAEAEKRKQDVELLKAGRNPDTGQLLEPQE